MTPVVADILNQAIMESLLLVLWLIAAFAGAQLVAPVLRRALGNSAPSVLSTAKSRRVPESPVPY